MIIGSNLIASKILGLFLIGQLFPLMDNQTCNSDQPSNGASEYVYNGGNGSLAPDAKYSLYANEIRKNRELEANQNSSQISNQDLPLNQQLSKTNAAVESQFLYKDCHKKIGDEEFVLNGKARRTADGIEDFNVKFVSNSTFMNGKEIQIIGKKMFLSFNDNTGSYFFRTDKNSYKVLVKVDGKPVYLLSDANFSEKVYSERGESFVRLNANLTGFYLSTQGENSSLFDNQFLYGGVYYNYNPISAGSVMSFLFNKDTHEHNSNKGMLSINGNAELFMVDDEVFNTATHQGFNVSDLY